MHIFAVADPSVSTVSDIEIDTPEPQGGEVRLRVLRAGVCHSDTHLREGYYDFGSRGKVSLVSRGMKYPLVLGHEVVGVVDAVGPDVTGIHPGDVRLVFPWIGCDNCSVCNDGNENLCATPLNLGVARFGGYADYISVPDAKYLLDIEGLDLSWAATLACSGLTAYSAARKAMPSSPSEPVVVIGAGGVGLTAIATLSALGHENICAVDLQERNLDLARGLGATTLIHADQNNLIETLLNELGGPAAGVIDFVNTGSTASTAFEILQKGGHMVQVGLFGGELTIPTVMLTLKVINIHGSFVGSLPELAELVELAKSGAIPHIPIIEGALTASEVDASLDKLSNGGVPGRIVLSAMTPVN